MAEKTHLTLQNTEGYIVQSAAQIYAAYITSGQVETGQESTWLTKSVREAILLAKATDDAIVAESEMM